MSTSTSQCCKKTQENFESQILSFEVQRDTKYCRWWYHCSVYKHSQYHTQYYKNWQRYWYSDITTDISQIALWCYFLSILVLVCSRRWLDNNMGVTVLMMMKILLLAFLQEELLGEKGSHFVLVLVLKESCDTSLTPRRGRWRSGLVPSAGGRQD